MNAFCRSMLARVVARRLSLAGAVLVLLSVAMAPAADAQTFSFDCITDNNAADCALGETTLSVEVGDADVGNPGPPTGPPKRVFMIFRNVPSDEESSASGPVIAQIYIEDPDGLLADLEAIDSPGVDFNGDASPGSLPGGNALDPPFITTRSLTAGAAPPAPKNGVGPFEQLVLEFNGDFADVSPELTPRIRIGIHVISFSGGGSESFVIADSPAGRCGDGIVHPGEDCDDGNDEEGDGCRSDCTRQFCGDGALDPGEECDDGNGDDDDCCTETCTLKPAGTACEVDDEVSAYRANRPRSADGDDDDGDGNECTDHRCDAAGSCVVVNNADPCEDGDACTVGDVCSGGGCSPGGSRSCDDDDVCTADACDSVLGCQNPPVLPPVPPGCACSSDTDCDNQNACDGVERCVDNLCEAGAPPACDDGNPCTNDSCDASGGCVNEPNVDPCDDGDLCTTEDRCSEGACVGGPPPDCNDDNVCTADLCDSTRGCSNPPTPGCTVCSLDGDCSNGNVCDGTETCVGGRCEPGTPLDCTPPDACTLPRACDALLGCQNETIPDCVPCATNQDCATTGEICVDGVCTTDNRCTSAADCNDNNPCTDDVCGADGGCTNPDNQAACTDGDACTVGDVCAGGACVPGNAADCADSNACTIDSCDSVAGCQNDFIAGCEPCTTDSDCSNGNVCDGAETCSAGRCASGTPLACGDTNACTVDSCDTASGCQNDPIAGCTACSTSADCPAGAPCTNGVCETVIGCVQDQDCNDGNPCTDDSCGQSGSCVFSPNSAPCDDGDLCTLADACADGACAGAPLCTDGNPCTTTECTAGVCGVTDQGAAPMADILVVIEASRSMRNDFKRWLPRHLRPLPQRLSEAGIDYRLAIVRFGTNRNQRRLQRGPLFPDMLLNWTSDPAVWEAGFDALTSDVRAYTEAGSEAITFGLDNTPWRDGAMRNILLYTDEDDDAPASEGGTRRVREPPRRGPASSSRQFTRWLTFQSRTDSTAERLISNQVQLHIVMNERDRPVKAQYGDPGATVTLPGGGLDTAATLARLVAGGNERSLQGQLLGSGECRGNLTCTRGRVGSPCMVDADCALLSRAYRLPRRNAEADTLFPGLVADIVSQQFCPVSP